MGWKGSWKVYAGVLPLNVIRADSDGNTDIDPSTLPSLTDELPSTSKLWWVFLETRDTGRFPRTRADMIGGGAVVIRVK